MKKILIGICGGIAAYKTQSLIRHYQRQGHEIKVILTPSALKFVTPLTIDTLAKSRSHTDEQWMNNDGLAHIDLSAWADVCIIAPLTANTLSKLSAGLCDNLLTSTVLALPTSSPLYIAPAMNTRMWENPLTQNNLSTFMKQRKKTILLPPREGKLACNEEGTGAMMSIEDMLKQIKLS